MLDVIYNDPFYYCVPRMNIYRSTQTSLYHAIYNMYVCVCVCALYALLKYVD